MIDISFKNKTGNKPELLSAIIGADSFFYGLFSSEYQLLECKRYEISDFESEEEIEKVKSDIYSIEGLKIKVTSTNKPYIHSPEHDAGKLLKFYPSFLNKENHSNKFTAQDVVVDYGLTKSQTYFLSKVLNGVSKMFHISTVLSNYYYPYSSPKLIAFVDNAVVHLFHGKNQEFLYYNQFPCVEEQDYLYFISLAYDQLGLNREEDELILSGRIDATSPIYKLLLGYIKNIDFMHSAKLDISETRHKDKQHYYLDLFATAICG